MTESTSSDQLIGRDAEIARSLSVLRGRGGAACAVWGEMGSGKTALLRRLVRLIEEDGRTVLASSGYESESALRYATLQQLLMPAAATVEQLEEPFRSRLAGVLDLSVETYDGSAEAIGVALCALLARLSHDSRVLLVIDDLHWVDAATLEALAALWRHPAPAADLVVSGLGRVGAAPEVVGRLGPSVTEIPLRPLARPEAEALLDRLTGLMPGNLRDDVLEQSMGNPAALLEFAHAATDAPNPGRIAGDPLPVSAPCAARYVARMGALPARVRRMLLLIAAAAPGEVDEAASRRLQGLTDRDWRVLDQAAVLRRDRGVVEFRHPLERAAIYQSTPFTVRAEAHRALAHALADVPDRRAWHLGKATLFPDEQIARPLADAAGRLWLRGDPSSATAVMERAVELTPTPAMQAHRLGAAVRYATWTGHQPTLFRIAVRAAAVTADPAQRVGNLVRAGWAQIGLAEVHDAFRTLLSCVEWIADQSVEPDLEHGGDAAAAAATGLADFAVAAAATAAHALATPEPQAAILAHSAAWPWPETDPAREEAADEPLAPQETDGARRLAARVCRLWVETTLDPFKGLERKRAELQSLHVQAPAFAGSPSVWGPDSPLSLLCAVAAALDEPEIAHSIAQIYTSSAANVTEGLLAAAFPTIAANLVDLGRWTEASALCAGSVEAAARSGNRFNLAATQVLMGRLAALQGRLDEARLFAEKAARLAAGVPVTEAALRHLSGTIALIEGDHRKALWHLGGLIAPMGQATPYDRLACHALTDYAQAAARLGETDEACAVVERLTGGAVELSRRVSLLAHTARALLARSRPEAEAHFVNALAEDSGRWPFDQARSRLHYAEWLRRARRINEAKAQLVAADAAFTALGARPWLERVRTEWRAAGTGDTAGAVRADDKREAATVLASLSPQQRAIVELAAQGLTNRDIAARLNLSPRTVSTHLYRSFQVLGVGRRTQLRGVMDESETA